MMNIDVVVEGDVVKMELTEKQIEKCNTSLNKKDIHKLGTGNFSKTYLKGNYIRHKLNDVFGIGQWNYTYELSAMKGEDLKTGNIIVIGYMAKVSLTIGELVLNDIGTGQLQKGDYMNEDKARKGAITDGLKRCAVNLGDAFGLHIVEESE